MRFSPIMILVKSDLSANEAVKVDQLCGRVLGDIGSIHARVSGEASDGKALPMSPDLVTLRRAIRELQDSIRETFPHAFYK
jgi:hypothetical protein